MEKSKNRNFFDYERKYPYWGNNIKVNLKKTGYECVDLIHLSKDRLQWWNFVDTINLCFPKKWREISGPDM